MISEYKKLSKLCVLLSLCALTISLAGCKAEEAPSAGFVDPSNMSKDPSLPFQRSWIKTDFDKSKYTKIYIAPVNTDYMLSMTDWQQGARRADFEQDVANLAVFAQNAIKKAFREDPKQRFQVLDAPTSDPDTLILEVAIVEVVPSKVVLNALGYAPFGIGLSINAVRFIAKDTSTCAFEARVRDAATQEIVATMADREAQQFAVVTVRGLTWYANAETIITQWAGQFVEIANRQPGQSVSNTPPFTLKPW
jgi:membrane protein implicated in regulation of membrane protease activity